MIVIKPREWKIFVSKQGTEYVVHNVRGKYWVTKMDRCEERSLPVTKEIRENVKLLDFDGNIIENPKKFR